MPGIKNGAGRMESPGQRRIAIAIPIPIPIPGNNMRPLAADR